MEQNVKKVAIFSEILAEFFGDGEDDMAMVAVQKFGGNGFRPGSLVSDAAGIAETGVASEGNDFVGAAMGAAVHGEAIGWLAA